MEAAPVLDEVFIAFGTKMFQKGIQISTSILGGSPEHHRCVLGVALVPFALLFWLILALWAPFLPSGCPKTIPKSLQATDLCILQSADVGITPVRG